MSKERKEAIKQIDEMSKENGGKIFLSLVHGFYGPLRGCNFIIKNSKGEEIVNYLDSHENDSKKVSSEEEMIKLLKDLHEGRKPESLLELCTKTWQETGMQVTMQILPFEMVSQCENPPKEVDSFQDGHKEILVQLAVGAMTKDPWFFRVGVL